MCEDISVTKQNQQKGITRSDGMKIKERGPHFHHTNLPGRQGNLLKPSLSWAAFPATTAKVVDPKRDPLGGIIWSEQRAVMVVMINLSRKFEDSGKMLIFNLLESCSQNTAWGQWLLAYWWDLVCVDSKPLPTCKNRAKLNSAEWGLLCRERTCAQHQLLGPAWS